MSDLLALPWSAARREVSPEEYLATCLAAIERLNPQLNAFLSVDREAANRSVPVAVKDNIVTSRLPTTCGSRMLESFQSPFDATAVQRLLEEGCAVVGKTNLDEFAMGSSNEHSAFGPVRNPWDLQRVPGGSSGGSAVAVAARMVPVALGSETGGSVRQPAALCGVVGLKPTYGRVSRSGLVAFASTLDQIGIFTKTVQESAEMLQIIAGHDPLDSTSSNEPAGDFTSGLTGGIRGVRFGIVREALEQLTGQVRENFNDAVGLLERGGALIGEASIPSLPTAVAIYYIVANAEASANLARFDGVRYGARAGDGRSLETLYRTSRAAGFGEEVKRRIMLGTFALSAGYYDAYYGRAQRARARLTHEIVTELQRFDHLITPTTPEPAFLLGSKVDDPISMYLSDIFTAPANLAGIPAIAVPSGFSREGLPLSLQIMSRHFGESALFRAAAWYERETNWWMRRPPLNAVDR